MNIQVIGHDSKKGFHFAEGIVPSLKKEEHHVNFLSCEEIQSKISPELWNLYRYKKQPVNLSEYIEDSDLIMVDQCDLYFESNVDIPLFYNHKYIHRLPSVSKADVIFFLTQPLLTYCRDIQFPWLCFQAKSLEVMASSINPSLFKTQKKTLHQVVGIGDRQPPEAYAKDPEILQEASIELIRRDIKKFKNYGFHYFDGPITDVQYRELLPTCKAVFFSFPRGQYFSRRMLEIMASKTLFVTQLHSERHEGVLKSNGFLNGVHYIGVDDISEIEQAYTETTNKEDIIENAYNEVIENHTFDARAKFIMKVYAEVLG